MGGTSIGSIVAPITTSVPLAPRPPISADIDFPLGAVARITLAPPSFCNSAAGSVAPLAKKLGADIYIDSGATDPAAELQKLGGASVILATAPSGKSMSALIGGLGANGTLMVIGATTDPIEVPPIQLILGKKRIQGWSAGLPTDSEDTLRFAEMTGIRPMIEKYPL